MDHLKTKFVDSFEFLEVLNYNKITNNIYLGNQKSSKSDIINKESFDVIVNCTPKLPFYSHKINYRINVKDDLAYHSITYAIYS